MGTIMAMLFGFALLGSAGSLSAAAAETGCDMRVFAEQPAAMDERAAIERDTNTVFQMTQFASKEEWEAYAHNLRRRILVSCGLWPLPERTPLNVKMEVVAQHPDYIVEKVCFESRPGVLVTGNLYRPAADGLYPGIACPHGHWETGRLEDCERGSIAARCITFARMGMVAFSYDMIGYNDSLQFPSHTWEDRKEALWGIHPFAFQLWNSMRVVDFLESLPYVDKNRLACTGASGGGTQTFALSAVEPRIKVAAPVNMISHTMQGGCICENAPILRLDASNMEIGALMAPRPMLMVSATGDWTKQTPEVEYPAIRGIYDLYGATERLANVHVDAEHNYNLKSREAVYRFFGKWLLDEADKWAEFTEPAYVKEADEKLLVFPDKTLPADFATKDALVPGIVQAERNRLRADLPKNSDEAAAFRTRYATALSDVIGAGAPAAEEIVAESLGGTACSGYSVERMVIRRPRALQAIPALILTPDAKGESAALVVHGQGKSALIDAATGALASPVADLLATGATVMVIDTFLTGEHVDISSARERKNGKFPDTFLPTDTAYRIQDILIAAAHLRAVSGKEPSLVGLGDAGVWTLFAAALDPGIAGVAADVAGFDPGDDAAWAARCYMPCIRGIGGLETAAALIAPRKLELINCQAPEQWQDCLNAYGNASGGQGAAAVSGGA